MRETEPFFPSSRNFPAEFCAFFTILFEMIDRQWECRIVDWILFGMTSAHSWKPPHSSCQTSARSEYDSFSLQEKTFYRGTICNVIASTSYIMNYVSYFSNFSHVTEEWRFYSEALPTPRRSSEAISQVPGTISAAQYSTEWTKLVQKRVLVQTPAWRFRKRKSYYTSCPWSRTSRVLHLPWSKLEINV